MSPRYSPGYRPVTGHRPPRSLTARGRIIVEGETTDGARLCPCGCNDSIAAYRSRPFDPQAEARRDILRGQIVALADRLVAARYSPAAHGHQHEPMCIHRLWGRWMRAGRFGVARPVLMWRAAVTAPRWSQPYGTNANLIGAWRLPEPEPVWPVLCAFATEARVPYGDLAAYSGRVMWWAARIIGAAR